jgi:hypothetical protein
VRLIDRVADLLHVQLGHHIEGRHGATLSSLPPGVGARVAKGSRL